MTHCYSNDSISNIALRNFIKALDLAPCADREILPYALKYRYYFPCIRSVDEFGVVVVFVVSPKQEELQFFFPGV